MIVPWYTSLDNCKVKLSSNPSRQYVYMMTLYEAEKKLCNHLYYSINMHPGVYLSLNGVFLTNNSDILITDIGTSSEPLVCTTDRMPCCRTPTAIGEWNFPDGEGLVPTLGGATKFYTNRSESGEVNLFRRSGDVMAPVGTFCCEVLDAADVYQTVCANIGEFCTRNITSFIFGGGGGGGGGGRCERERERERERDYCAA